MKVYVLTKDRVNCQVTADQLNSAGVEFTFACSAGDEPFPKGNVEVFGDGTIEKKRQEIIDCNSGKTVMIDDDIRFLIRGAGGGAKTRVCAPKELKRLFDETQLHLDKFDLVGLAERFMINNRQFPSVSGHRQIHFFAFNSGWIRKRNIRIDRIPVAEDLDFIMQIFSAGGIQHLRTDYCHQDKKQFGPGGCSSERTNTTHNSSMERLRELWPDYVSLRRRKGIWRPYINWNKLARS